MKFFKQLFCRHRKKFYYNRTVEPVKHNTPEPLYLSVDVSVCEKCGKEFHKAVGRVVFFKPDSTVSQ